MPIAVYEGKAHDGWTVTGQVLVGDKDAKTFIIVNATDVKGFNFDSWTNAGLVMVLDYKVLEKFYDGANANEGEWYLNGATEYGEVLAYNFYTGKFEDVTTSTNLKPKKGYIYQTIDNVLVAGYESTDFLSMFSFMSVTYGDWKYDSMNNQPMVNRDGDNITSDYVFETFIPVVADYFGDDAKKEFSKAEVSYVLGVNKNANDLVNSLKFVKIVNDKDGNVAGIEAYGKDEWKADVKAGLVSIYGHAVYAIRDDGTVDVVVYIDPNTMTGTEVVKEDVTATTSNVIGIQEDAGIAGTVKADKVVETVNGVETEKFVVKSLTFDFVGSCPEKDNHSTILQHGLFWDAEGKCDLNDWCVYVNQERVYGQDIKTSTYAYTKDCETYFESYKCALIKAFEAAVKGIEVVEGEETRVDVFVSGLNTEFTLTLSVNAKGKLVVEFNEAVEQVLFGTVADVVASVK